MQHVLRQTVSRNMGYEVCQEVPLHSVNKGVLELKELLKREESSLPSSTCSLGRLTFDLSVTEEDPLNSIWCNRIPNLPSHLCFIKTRSYLKVLGLKHSQCTQLCTLTTIEVYYVVYLPILLVFSKTP